jgi:hypothetical protein
MPRIPAGVLLGDFFLATQAFPGSFLIQLGRRCSTWSESKRRNFFAMVILGGSIGAIDSRLGGMSNPANPDWAPDSKEMQQAFNTVGLEAGLKQTMMAIIGVYNGAAMTLVSAGADKLVTAGGIAIGALAWGGDQLTATKVPAAVKALQSKYWYSALPRTVIDFENLL